MRTNQQKLIISVVQRDDAQPLMDALNSAGLGSVELSSTGGFLRRGNATILTVGHADQVDRAIDIVRQTASSRVELRDPGVNLQVTEWYVPQSFQVQTGGASVWVLDADLAGYLPALAGPSEDNGV